MNRNQFMRYLILTIVGFLSLPGYGGNCREVFSNTRFENETVAVFKYLAQPIPSGKKNFFKKNWKSIDESWNPKLFAKNAAKIAKLLAMRTESSKTLAGAEGVSSKENREALKRFKASHKFILQSLNTPISIDLIATINSLHTTGRLEPAEIRVYEVQLGHGLYKMIAPKDLAPAMEYLMDWYSTAEASGMHPIELAARFYQLLVSIHPFTDGNGRTARDLMDLVLMKHGYPPAIFAGRSTFSRSGVAYGVINPPKGWPQAQHPVEVISEVTAAIMNSISLVLAE